jgi:hypothetical protein
MSGIEDETLIIVSDLVEHEDGSATLEVKTSPDVTAMLVGIGLTQLVKTALAEELKQDSEVLCQD